MSPMLNRVLKALLPLLVVGVALAAAYVMYLNRPPVETQTPVVAAPAVRVQPVAFESVDLTVSSQGTVQPRTSSQLVPEIAGTVLSVSPAFAVGGFFEEGEVLLQIDPYDYQQALIAAQSQLAQARLRLATEEAEAEVARREWEEIGQGSASPLTLRQPQVEDARAAVASAEAAIDRARRDLERAEVRAPYAGRVQSKDVDVGQFVNRGTAVGRIYAVDSAEVRLPLPDDELAYVDVPMSYRGTQQRTGPAVTLSADFAGRRYSWRGRIVRTEGEIDAVSRMVHVVAEVDDPYAPGPDPTRPPLAVGMFVEAEIAGRRVDDVVVLPWAALNGRDRVLIVDDDGRLRYRQVEVLRSTTESVLVSGGLEEGDRVSISALDAVVDGMAVQIAGGEPAMLARAGAGADPAADRGVAETPAADPVAELRRERGAGAVGDPGAGAAGGPDAGAVGGPGAGAVGGPGTGAAAGAPAARSDARPAGTAQGARPGAGRAGGPGAGMGAGPATGAPAAATRAGAAPTVDARSAGAEADPGPGARTGAGARPGAGIRGAGADPGRTAGPSGATPAARGPQRPERSAAARPAAARPGRGPFELDPDLTREEQIAAIRQRIAELRGAPAPAPAPATRAAGAGPGAGAEGGMARPAPAAAATRAAGARPAPAAGGARPARPAAAAEGGTARPAPGRPLVAGGRAPERAAAGGGMTPGNPGTVAGGGRPGRPDARMARAGAPPAGGAGTVGGRPPRRPGRAAGLTPDPGAPPPPAAGADAPAPTARADARPTARPARTNAAAADAPRPVVALLPFRNVSRNPADEVIGEEMRAVLRIALERAAGMRVVLLAPADESNAIQRAMAGDATWLAGGGIQRVGEQLRVTGRIIDVATGDLLGSVRVDGTVAGRDLLTSRLIAALRAELAGHVPAPTAPRMAAAAPAPPPPPAPVPDPIPAPTARRAIRLAVSPFANISRNPADDAISDAIAAEIVGRLGGVPGIAILPLDTGAAEAPALPAAAARGADWLVTGGYQHVAGRLRLTARLLRVSDGAVAESIRVDGTVDGLPDLLAEAVSTFGAAVAAGS